MRPLAVRTAQSTEPPSVVDSQPIERGFGAPSASTTIRSAAHCASPGFVTLKAMREPSGAKAGRPTTKRPCSTWLDHRMSGAPPPSGRTASSGKPKPPAGASGVFTYASSRELGENAGRPWRPPPVVICVTAPSSRFFTYTRRSPSASSALKARKRPSGE